VQADTAAGNTLPRSHLIGEHDDDDDYHEVTAFA
jgi:hypothetical protein